MFALPNSSMGRALSGACFSALSLNSPLFVPMPIPLGGPIYIRQAIVCLLHVFPYSYDKLILPLGMQLLVQRMSRLRAHTGGSLRCGDTSGVESEADSMCSR
jgi:hypothetical protein